MRGAVAKQVVLLYEVGASVARVYSHFVTFFFSLWERRAVEMFVTSAPPSGLAWLMLEVFTGNHRHCLATGRAPTDTKITESLGGEYAAETLSMRKKATLPFSCMPSQCFGYPECAGGVLGCAGNCIPLCEWICNAGACIFGKCARRE